MKTRLFPCVIERLRQNAVICACYELDEVTNTREGELLVLEVDSEQSVSVEQSLKIDAGVLDCKILDNVVYAALSTEKLCCYSISTDNNSALSIAQCISKEGEGLFLSVSVVPITDVPSSSRVRAAVSTQQGSIIVYETAESGELQEIYYSHAAHKLAGEAIPAWIVALNNHNPDIMVSGGDDCKFCLWDCRISGDSARLATKTFHDAGVTSAQWHPDRENIFVLGSYDESVSVWDSRNIKRPILLHSTGGGVWRSKWISPAEGADNQLDFLLTANMQGGCNMYKLRWGENADSLEVVEQVHHIDESDKHLSYGIDFLSYNYLQNEDRNKNHIFSIASCSFYDRQVSIWNAEF